ncbi:MAG: extracellular solute-binding protein [Oscillospiraceae bacterium]
MKKNGLTKALSVVLAFTFLAMPLTACGDKKGEGTNGEALSEFVYIPKYTSLPKEITEMSSPYGANGTIYFTANVPTDADGKALTEEEMKKMEESMMAAREKAVVNVSPDGMASSSTAVMPDMPEITYVPTIYSVKTDGSDYHKLADYVAPKAPEGQEGGANLNKVIADAEGNVWVAENIRTTYFNLPPDFDATKQDKWEFYDHDDSKVLIRKLSNTGAEISSLDISQFVEKPAAGSEEENMGMQFYVGDMSTDKTGNLYLTDGNSTVYVVDKAGAFQFKVSVDGWLDRIIMLKDGTVGVSTRSKEGKNVLKTVDLAKKDWGKEVALPANAYQTSSGGNEYDFCYTDGGSLFGYDAATEKSTKILSWLNSDVDGNNVSFSTILDDGNVFAITNDWNNEGGASYEVITLTKTPRSEAKQKKIITMATMYLDYNIRKELLKFNKTNPDYRVEVLDYSEFNTEDNYTAGQTKLNTEIISGKVPDIIDVSNMPYRQYASKGLLEDLNPYIDKDTGIKRDDFFPSIMKAVETDGKLYQLVSSFGVSSIIGASSVVGDEMGWTIEEMQKIIDEHPNADVPFGAYVTRDTILTNLCMLNMESYVDWQTGECKFNTDEFKQLLTFAKSFPEKIDEPQEGDGYLDPSVLAKDGRQLFENFYASDFQNYQYYKAVFGGKITFKGLPTADKNGNIAMLSGGLAMTSSCKDKDGAWAFMRTLVTPEYQESLEWNYPISQSAYNKLLAKAMEQEYRTDENGNKVPVSHGGMSMGDGMTVDFFAITQEEADQIRALIDSVEKTGIYDESIMGIIKEEATLFFKGEKTVEQTAEMVQSRMSIYVNEQK